MFQAVAPSTSTPFAALSLIVAPAILTNACSVLIMSTSNRVARAVDLSREVGRELDALSPGAPRAESDRWLDEMSAAHTRSVLLVRALRALYTALGGFSSATLLALLGVVLESQLAVRARWLPEALAVLSGVIGVGGIVWAAALLLSETRIAVTALDLRFSAQRNRFPQISPR
jgi:Protein of unknown function (DUF2721)